MTDMVGKTERNRRRCSNFVNRGRGRGAVYFGKTYGYTDSEKSDNNQVSMLEGGLQAGG